MGGLYFLSKDDILEIQEELIAEFGGMYGFRNEDAIEGIINSPQQTLFGEYAYDDIFQMAAVYIREINTQHPFIDGNKRTSAGAAILFLEKNGALFEANNDMELYHFIIDMIASGKDITGKSWDIEYMAD